MEGVFHGNRISKKLKGVRDGIYSLDGSADDMWATLAPADILGAVKAFRQYSNFSVVRGISFHDGIVPDNPVAFSRIPIPVKCGNFDEYTAIEVAMGKFGCVYLQDVDSLDAYVLMEVATTTKSGGGTTIKGLTPAIRLVRGFHILEKRRKEESEPANLIKSTMRDSGAEVLEVKKRPSGWEVLWRMMEHTISTVLDRNFRVVEAGFCTSGGDRSQTARSVPHLLKSYVDEGSRIYKTRSVD